MKYIYARADAAHFRTKKLDWGAWLPNLCGFPRPPGRGPQSLRPDIIGIGGIGGLCSYAS